VEPTDGSVQSGKSTSILVSVLIKQEVFNMKIRVDGNDLLITGGPNGNNEHEFRNLKTNERRQLTFDLTIPEDARVGERFNITFSVQSHSEPPGPIGIRSPLDYPEDIDSRSFLLEVAPVPPPPPTPLPSRDETAWIGPLLVAAIVISMLIAIFKAVLK